MIHIDTNADPKQYSQCIFVKNIILFCGIVLGLFMMRNAEYNGIDNAT
jgi:hypothetical protein